MVIVNFLNKIFNPTWNRKWFENGLLGVRQFNKKKEKKDRDGVRPHPFTGRPFFPP